MNAQSRETTYEFGDFRVDVAQRLLLLKADGRALPLNSRAFDMLVFFLQHPGELLDKSTLMAAIWPKLVVEENNLNQQISALRRVLGEHPEQHRFIVTVPGRGYRFIAPVRPAADSATASDRADVPAASPIPPVTPEVTGRRRAAAHTQKAWVFGVAGLILAVSLGWYFTQRTVRRASPALHTSPVTSIDVVPVHKLRLAVLPFENLSPDPANAFFADGLHEEILSTIAERVPGIEVVSRTTMMSYRTNPPKPVALVARELLASHLIEGSVRREGSKVRLTLQLIDARTDGPIWSASYDRTLADTLALESQVAEQVAEQLSARLTHPDRSPAAPIRDAEAFDLYLKALLALRVFAGNEPDKFQEIEDLLARVIALDPTFALAYAQRARARTLMFITSQNTTEAFVRQIRADLDIARRLAPKDPIVLASYGYFLMCENDTTGALEAFEGAEAAGLAEPEWLIPKAHLLLRRSRIDEMDAITRRMLVIDPANPLVIWFAAFHFWRARQPNDALQALQYSRAAVPATRARLRGYIMLEFAGRTEELRSFLGHYAPTDDPRRLAQSLGDYFTLLLFEHRYADLRAQIDRVPVTSQYYYGDVHFQAVDSGPVGPSPTALFRGWTDLLLGDRVGAAKDGRTVLKFVERQARTAWNGAHLEALAAAGHAFAGECESARAAGRNALALVSRADNGVVWRSTALRVAYIDAWCGGQDDAVALLDQLANARPGVGPAWISRHPLFTVPLGQLPAYLALADKLETTIRAGGFE